METEPSEICYTLNFVNDCCANDNCFLRQRISNEDMDDGDRVRFLVEWFDPTVKAKRQFLLTYFLSDGTVEMYDRQSKKMFLKRFKCDNVDAKDLYLGSVVNILSRQLLITGFGDKKTEERFTKSAETSIILIMKDGLKFLGTILDILQSNGLTLNKGRITANENSNVYAESSFNQHLESYFAVFEVRGENAMDVLKRLLGMDTIIPANIKVELGGLSEYCLTPRSKNECLNELNIFFPPNKVHSGTAVLNNSTCCIIKPHAVRDKKAGKIIQDIIDAGYNITALQFLNFNLATATEFYEVYKGVVPYYQDMVSQLMSGSCIALEIMKKNTDNIVQDFRSFVGPNDPVVAQKLRPKTLRALYGESDLKNAIHCTDLPEDGKLEVEYAFRIMPLI